MLNRKIFCHKNFSAFTLVAMKSSLDLFKKRVHSRQCSLKLSGFTLVEIMIVVAVIALIAAIAIPNLRRVVLDSKFSESKVFVKRTSDAIEQYSAITGAYPKDLTSLTSPTPPYMSVEYANKIGCYLNQGFCYVCKDGLRHALQFDVDQIGKHWIYYVWGRTCGPDGADLNFGYFYGRRSSDGGVETYEAPYDMN